MTDGWETQLELLRRRLRLPVTRDNFKLIEDPGHDRRERYMATRSQALGPSGIQLRCVIPLPVRQFFPWCHGSGLTLIAQALGRARPGAPDTASTSAGPERHPGPAASNIRTLMLADGPGAASYVNEKCQ